MWEGKPLVGRCAVFFVFFGTSVCDAQVLRLCGSEIPVFGAVWTFWRHSNLRSHVYLGARVINEFHPCLRSGWALTRVFYLGGDIASRD